jgi:hypothetical protein
MDLQIHLETCMYLAGELSTVSFVFRHFCVMDSHAQFLMSGSYLNDLWQWSPESRIWSNIGQRTSALDNPSPRSNVGFTRLGNSLFVLGGMGKPGFHFF